MFNQDYYFQTIRKYVSLFGTMFSEINISRTNSANTVVDYIRVPITYAAKERMLARVQQAPLADRASASLTLPVMSFEITTMAYDGDRKLGSTGRTAFVNTTTPSQLKYQYNPVPYDLGFSLYIWVKNPEDGTKIVEQILPYFTPDFTVTVIMIPELNIKAEVPIILTSISQENNYQGNFKQDQPIIWTLNFTIKGSFYGPIKSQAVILFANTNLHIPDSSVPIANAVGNTATISFISVYPGQSANGLHTSNAQLTIPANTILANSDFGYITTYGEVLKDLPALSVDLSLYTVDSAKIQVDQNYKHNY